MCWDIQANLCGAPSCCQRAQGVGSVAEGRGAGAQVTAAAWPAHPAWLAAFLVVLGTKIEHT